MKKIISYSLICLLLTSCQKTNQEKAESLASVLKEADPNVEDIEFGTLEKAQLDYELTMPAYKLREEMRKNMEIAKEKQRFIDQWKDINPAFVADDIKEVKKRTKYVIELNDSFELEKKRFHHDTTRYMMAIRVHHVYPKTNKNKIENLTVFFDKDISRIVGGIEPIGNNGELVYIEIDSDFTRNNMPN